MESERLIQYRRAFEQDAKAAAINYYAPEIIPILPDQEAFERDVVWTMYIALQSVRDKGYSDWQTLTSFFANLLLDQDNPQDAQATVRRIPDRSSTSSATSASVR